MAKRLNISVSDSLFDDLNSFKDKLNVSKVCQKAIRQAIDIEQLKQETNVDDIDKLVERIKKEKNEYGAIYKNEGFRDGIKDAHSMDFGLMAYYDCYYRDSDVEELFEYLSSSETSKKYEALLDNDFEFIDTTKDSEEKIDKIHSSGKYTVDLRGSDRSTSIGLSLEEFLSFSDFKDMYLNGFRDGIEHIVGLVRERGAL